MKMTKKPYLYEGKKQLQNVDKWWLHHEWNKVTYHIGQDSIKQDKNLTDK